MNYDKVIAGCIQGKASYQRKLVSGFAPIFKAIALRYLPDEPSANDAVQEAFVNVFRYIKNYQGKGSFEGWMRRIAVNAALNYRKKHFKQKGFVEVEVLDKTMITHPDVYHTLNHNELLEFIKQLPEQYYLVFTMHIIEGFSHNEIATSLDISESASRANLSRARQKLRNLLSKKENSSPITEKHAI